MSYTVLSDLRISKVAEYLSSGADSDPFHVELRGTIVWDQILDLSGLSNIYFDAGWAKCITTMAPAVGLANDNTNALIKCAPASIAFNAVSTTLGAIAYPNDTTLTLATTARVAAGDWLEVYSENGASRPANYVVGTEDIPVYRLYKVKSVDSATVVSIYGQVRYWQVNGSTVRKISPSRNITWLGGNFDCSGGSIADGFSYRGVLGARIEGSKFTGFSRGGIDLWGGTSDVVLADISHGGECNSVIHCRGSEYVSIDRFSSPTVASLTKHANGTPRALITLRCRAAGTTISNARFAWGTLGLRIWAVDNLVANTMHFENLDGNGISGAVEGRGVAIDGGQVSIAAPVYANDEEGASFSAGVTMSNIYIGTCKAKSTQCLLYFHDTLQQIVEGVIINDHGNGDGTGGSQVTPIIVSDAPNSQLRNVTGMGTKGLIATENGAMNNGIMENLLFQAACGTGYSFGYLFSFNHGATTNMTIRNVRITNGGYHWEFGTQFDDPYLTIEEFQADDWVRPASRLRICVNGGARPSNSGQIMQYTGSLGGTGNKYPIVGTPTAGAQQKCVASVGGAGYYFETGVNGGFGMVQELKMGLKANVRLAQAVGTGPTATQGDILRHCAAGDGAVGNTRADNAATYITALGCVIGALPTGGTVGLVSVT